jgi:iron(III) transport system ATP-binding protein
MSGPLPSATTAAPMAGAEEQDMHKAPPGAETMRTVILRLESVGKTYSGASAAAVSDIHLAVGDGEVLGLVGESGCGKSTLLRLVAGLEVPDRGTIHLAGRTVAGPRAWTPPERRGVGMVFQDFALFPHLSAAGNIMYGLASRPRKERSKRAEELLELVGLGSLGARFPHQLSGGQQQRVALARALAPEPRVLLLDEPFSNLDSGLRRVLRSELAEILRRTGITAILVVHDAEDVTALADRVAVMRTGRIRQIESPAFLYKEPLDEYVARFFGETNILHARPRDGGFETAIGFIPCAMAAASSGAVRLCLRPEHFHLSVEAGTHAGECGPGCGDGTGCGMGGRRAVVRRVTQSGLHRRIVLEVETGSPGGTGLTVDVGPEPQLGLGDIVYVQPQAGRLHVLEGEVAGEE